MDGDESGDTGGDAESGGNNGWNDEHTGTLWGWLSGIFGGLETIWEAVSNLPQLIADKIKGFFDDVVDAVEDVWDAILELPTLILEGIKAIFIPDTEYIDTAFNGFLDELKMKFGIDTGFFESLFQGESAVDDVEGNYNIPGVGSFNLTFLDSSYLVQGVTYFRPFIRGFLVLLMALYHIKQLLGFFGYNAGVVAGRSEWIEYNRANTGGHKE